MSPVAQGVTSFARRAQVWTHMHDRATKWPSNSATITASQLARWFGEAVVSHGLGAAITLTPYTNPELWPRYSARTPAMVDLLAHAASLTDRTAELGFPVIAGVEANIVPLDPGSIHGEYAIDVPDEVLAQLSYVIASGHAQPPETEKLLASVIKSRTAACQHPNVTTLGHFDRYVQHLGWPDLAFFEQMRQCGTALEINENYLRRFGLLEQGVQWRSNWSLLTRADYVLSEIEFNDGQLNKLGTYMDYRYAHIVSLACRSGVAIAIGLDWHLPHDPAEVDFKQGQLGPQAFERLERFGNWLNLRKVPVWQCITASTERFMKWTAAPKDARYKGVGV